MQSVPDTHDDTYTTEMDDRRREKLINMAVWHGVKVGAATLGACSVATYFINKKSNFFRNYASINGKVSIPIIIAMFTTSVVTELAIQDARTSPEKWDGGKPANLNKAIVANKPDVNSLPMYKQTLLKIYENPLTFAAMLGVPLAGRIMYSRFGQSHLSTSQALMQTRVFAQFGVISILMSTVSIRFLVDYNDHFGCHHRLLTDEERYAKGWAEPKHNAAESK